jgi:hypothetical protein
VFHGFFVPLLATFESGPEGGLETKPPILIRDQAIKNLKKMAEAEKNEIGWRCRIRSNILICCTNREWIHMAHALRKLVML